MKFKLDENFGTRMQEIFRQAGHDVHSVVQEGLQGTTDQAIYQICCAEQRCLITFDLDLSDIIRFSPKNTGGIVVIRVQRNPSLGLLEQMITALLRYIQHSSIVQQLLIVEPGRIRIHQGEE